MEQSIKDTMLNEGYPARDDKVVHVEFLTDVCACSSHSWLLRPIYAGLIVARFSMMKDERRHLFCVNGAASRRLLSDPHARLIKSVRRHGTMQMIALPTQLRSQF